MDGVCAETTEAQLRALRPDLLPDPIGKERQPVPGNPWDDSVTEGRDLLVDAVGAIATTARPVCELCKPTMRSIASS